MGKWVLIIVIWSWSNGAIAITTHEFSSKENCSIAGESIRPSNVKVTTVCVEK